MKMHLADVLHRFLFKHGLIRSKLLLAISGGPDSMALLHGFCSKHHFSTLQIGVAHIDHGWRPESKQEAQSLEKTVRSLEKAWHLKTLNPKDMKGNLEDACREARLDFFTELCHQFGYEGVVLAHHADDQAETVLKRLFEGSSLLSTKGMQEKSKQGNITLYRPFIKVTKNEILSHLEENKISAFIDPTNEDEKFTRAKLRKTIIPFLTSSFGKEIAIPLGRLSETLHELDDFILSSLPPIIKGWNGWMVDCNPLRESHSFLFKHALIALFRNEKLTVPHAMLESIFTDLKEHRADKTYLLGKKSLSIDRGYFFILDPTLPLPPRMKLNYGENLWGPWKITLSENKESTSSSSGWKTLWKGQAHLEVADNEYFVDIGHNDALYMPPQKKLGRWWTESKVPAFLRTQVPVIYNKDAVAAEFLGPPPINDRSPLLITLLSV